MRQKLVQHLAEKYQLNTLKCSQKSVMFIWMKYLAWGFLLTRTLSSSPSQIGWLFLCRSVIDTIVRANIDLYQPHVHTTHHITAQCESVCFLMRLLLINGSLKHEWRHKQCQKEMRNKIMIGLSIVFMSRDQESHANKPEWEAIPLQESLLVSLVHKDFARKSGECLRWFWIKAFFSHLRCAF